MLKNRIGPFERLWVLLPAVVLLWGCQAVRDTDPGAPPSEPVGPSGASVGERGGENGPRGPYAKEGFVVEEEEGRLWVLRPGEEKGEKHVTLVGAGPDGMTLKALDRDTAVEYVATRPGFHVEVEDGRIWVFRLDGPRERSEKHVTRVGVGPLGTTLKALDRETLDAYLAAED